MVDLEVSSLQKTIRRDEVHGWIRVESNRNENPLQLKDATSADATLL